MKYTLILSVLFLTACGSRFQTKHDPRTIRGVDPVFQPYLDEYTFYKGSALSHDIPIQFADLDGFTVGLCTRWSTGERQIEIDRDYWVNYLDDNERFETVMHELGHCDLNRGHELTTVNEIPVSVMYPYVFTLFTVDIPYYMAELFNPYVSHVHVAADCVKYIEVE